MGGLPRGFGKSAYRSLTFQLLAQATTKRELLLCVREFFHLNTYNLLRRSRPIGGFTLSQQHRRGSVNRTVSQTRRNYGEPIVLHARGNVCGGSRRTAGRIGTGPVSGS